MNKQEAIEKLKEVSWECEDNSLVVSLDYAQEIISQIDETQKVVVPKFVAEWIEELKKSHSNLAWVWQVYPNETKIKNWLESNTEKFMRAWLDGYEIEKEKLYTVEIAEAILTKITRGSNIQYKMLPSRDVSDVFDKAIYTTRLTEQEIKQKDERLWQFAKEVE